MSLQEYLDSQRVIFIPASTRDDTLATLTDLLSEQGLVEDRDAFLQALLEREKIVSTGIGMGVAIPHAKLASCPEFFIAIAVLDRGVDWDALDSTAVRLIFMIGGPDDRQTEYLQILSDLTSLLRDDRLRRRILNTRDPEAVVEILLERPET